MSYFYQERGYHLYAKNVPEEMNLNATACSRRGWEMPRHPRMAKTPHSLSTLFMQDVVKVPLFFSPCFPQTEDPIKTDFNLALFPRIVFSVHSCRDVFYMG